MSFHDKGNAVPIAIIGFMTASRRLRMAGGLLGLFLTTAGAILWLAYQSGADPAFRQMALFAFLFGGAFLLFWLIASVLSWFIRITREDIQRES